MAHLPHPCFTPQRQQLYADVPSESASAYKPWDVSKVGVERAGHLAVLQTLIRPPPHPTKQPLDRKGIIEKPPPAENAFTSGTRARPVFLPSTKEVRDVLTSCLILAPYLTPSPLPPKGFARTGGAAGAQDLTATARLRRTDPAEYLNRTDPGMRLTSTRAEFPPRPLHPHDTDRPAAKTLPAGPKTSTGYTNNQDWYRPRDPKDRSDDHFQTTYKQGLVGVEMFLDGEGVKLRRG